MEKRKELSKGERNRKMRRLLSKWKFRRDHRRPHLLLTLGPGSRRTLFFHPLGYQWRSRFFWNVAAHHWAATFAKPFIASVEPIQRPLSSSTDVHHQANYKQHDEQEE